MDSSQILEELWDFIFTWHIENFEMLVRRASGFDSPVFKVERLEFVKWFLRLRYDDPEEGDLSCYLCRDMDEGPQKKIKLGASLAIVAYDAELSFEQRVPSDVFRGASLKLWSQKLETIHSLFALYHEDSLTLRLTLWGDSPPHESAPPENPRFCSAPLAEESYEVVDDGGPGVAMIHPTRCTARTRVEVFRHSFPWYVHHIDFDHKTRDASIAVESALRDAGSLRLTFRYRRASKRRLCIEVCRVVPDFARLTFVRCAVSFLGKSGVPKPYAKAEHLFTGGADHTWVLPGLHDPGQLKFNNRNTWYNNVFQGTSTLKLQVELSMSHEGCEYQIGSSASHVILEDLQLQNRYQSLYESERDSDVVLRTSGRSIRAHRSVLSARSPVFRAMLDKDMAEGNTGDIHIPDLDPDTVEQLVIFMYSARVHLTALLALGLYVAADKYDVPTLREECVWFLKSGLTVKTATEAFRVAKIYQDANLMNYVRRFIIARSADVLHSPEWEDLAMEYPRHANEFALEVLREKTNYDSQATYFQ